ncbi:O-methyltransferase-domain-containing protein [Echria macrotheca]|uniref:O-methyltransferase-domain-containing protein n=1 Tax=Echria macrotheca TaxID=438768 RepID=A0AAJ0BJ40_9PEZI|nr:O-methyltransferase-domain-containing protein [Echria macrotheca]
MAPGTAPLLGSEPALPTNTPSAEAVKALHAVHEIISKFFANGTSSGPNSSTTSEPGPLSESKPHADAENGHSSGANGTARSQEANSSSQESNSNINKMNATTTSPSPKPGPGPKLDPEQLRSLAGVISESVDIATTTDGPEAKEAVRKMAAASQSLSNALRPPPEAIMGWFTTASVVSAVRVFMAWGVFDEIPSGPQGISIDELAQKVKTQPSLLVRISSMLTSASILRHIIPATTTQDEKAATRLAHTPTSMLLRAGQPMEAMFKVLYTNIVEVSTILPDYFEKYGRTEPLGPAEIPTSYLAGKPERSYFEHIGADPDRLANFNRAMSITHRNVPTTGVYDMTEVCRAAAAEEVDDDAQRTLWVDVGGGLGHTVKLFCEEYGLPPARCMVQDLPDVIREAEKQNASDAILRQVRFVPLDFHKEGPVPGALRYYLRHILRDYSDPIAVGILRNVAGAMVAVPDSRVLVAEQILDAETQGPGVYAAFKDYTMLAIGGKERTLAGFEALAEAAGLQVCGVWRDNKGGTGHGVVEMKVRRSVD